MRTTIWMACVAALAASAANAGAQTARTTQGPRLTIAGAKAVAAAAVVEATRVAAPGGAIAVVDEGGHLLYLERLDGTFAAGAGIAEAKARTAALFRRPTKGMEDAIVAGRTTLLNVAEAPLQGGVPLVVDGVVVGAIGVSGAASAEQDTELAIAGAKTMLSSAPSSADGDSGDAHEAGLFHLAGDAVRSAFHRGVPLLEVPDYKIHASRRTEAGMAEVHERDTDIIYVLEGRATFVTGGDVEAGRTTAPDEIRGAAIRGGSTRTLARGDVMVVPAGVPHWFRQVEGPFLYYVVKVANGG